MKVTNNALYPLIAFAWHVDRGYGEDTTINPGTSEVVKGPYIGEMGDGACHIDVPGEITCQETPDDEHGFQVTLGCQLNLKSGDVGITVRHHLEPRIIEEPTARVIEPLKPGSPEAEAFLEDTMFV